MSFQMDNIQSVFRAELLKYSLVFLCVCVVPLPADKPQVTFLSSNQTVNNGNDALFYCQAAAYLTPITYSWFRDGNPITSDPNGDYFIDTVGLQSRLRAKQVKKSSAGQYSCSGSNTMGAGERKSTSLIVQYPPTTVTITPDPAVVPQSQSITLTCQSDGYPAPSFYWKFNGNIVNGAQQNTLVLTSVEPKDAGNYTCIANNFRGSKETTRVVNVEYQPTVTTFTTGTPGNTVVQGTTVTLKCSANGYPAPTYTIKRGNTPVSQSSPGKVVINNVQLSDEDQPYSCVPRNKEGDGPTTSFSITVHVIPSFNPRDTLPTTKETKNENETLSYTCAAQAKPAANIQWVLNGQNLTNTPPYNINASFASIPSSKLLRTIGYLTVKHLTWRQYGNFSCIAINAAGTKRQSTELEVRYRPVVQFPADHPQNLTMADGARATFTCKTIGNPPTTGHKWQFNGVDIPGEACASGCTSTTTFTIGSVRQQDAGWYACIGTNILGDGPPAKAQLLIKHEPKINYFPQSVYTVNETNNVSMVCKADGVPMPTITWTKTSNSRTVGEGETFQIVNTSGSDDGTYTCTARNELGSDSKELTLHVQTRPTILTSTPITTNIPGAEGEEVELICIVSGKPAPSLSWKKNLNVNKLTLNDPNVKSITMQEKTIKMKVTVNAAGKDIGDQYYCVAVNILGSDAQKYIIRERGAPDPPQDVKLVPFQVPQFKTVSVNVSWTPGYSGGFDQEFSIHYRKIKSGGDFTEEIIGHPANNMHTVQKLSPNTEYEFKMLAYNQRGKSQTSPEAQVTTPDSAVAPDRGTVKATRMSDDATVIVVTWTVTDKKVTKLSLEIQEGGEGGWASVTGADGLSTSTTEFKVENLKADTKYKFRLDMRRPGEESPSYVESNEVPANPSIGQRGDDEPLKNWMIAVIAAVAGVLLLAIVVLCLCCFKRRKKARGADQVNMSQTSNYVVGGPEVSRALDTRPRSYGMESVEDDPFIEAHFASMQSMNSTDAKKKKGENGVNFGYLSQDSVQPQPEMLLDPGSRLSRNRPMTQSTGELDANSAYPARGPQRDFSTLPPYHEPPSFEEAMRQSGRKPKTRKSTGDLTGPGQARHSGRRPRQSPHDEPTDSSDGEMRYTPQRAAPPPPRVRHVEPNEDPGYAIVDKGRVVGPRVLPQGPLTTSAPRNGPLDPTVPYAVPQKKKSRKPRNEPSEPAFGPPPQYTPEDRSPDEPVHYPGDLDLDDPANLPPSERPPDLPPPMAMLPSNRGKPSYHDDPHDGMPEPPTFLRDIVYSPDGRDTRYDSDGPAPHHRPPSPGRQRQPYVNIHGQLVRPSSRESDDFRRPESLRSSRDALTPEPEMPPRQWQPRGSESDDRGAPEINYFSHLV